MPGGFLNSQERSMTNIVIPVKNPSSAKQRLGFLLSPNQRRTLALTLLDTVLSAVLPCRPKCNVLLVTDSDEIRTKGESSGVAVILEETSAGETAAVERATRWSRERRFNRQIVIPGDLPCVLAEDVDRLLSVRIDLPSVVLCPATGDDGTNAIMTTPPDVLTFRFGRKSFPEYLDQSRRIGVACEVLRLPRLVLDLDTPDDLKTFLNDSAANAGAPAYRLLREWNIGLEEKTCKSTL